MSKYHLTLNMMFLGYIHADVFRFPHCNNFIHCIMSIICCIYVLLDLICVFGSIYINEQITNVRQSNVNLSPLVLPCSRILLVQGEIYCLACSRWALGFIPTQLVFSVKQRENFIVGIEYSLTCLGMLTSNHLFGSMFVFVCWFARLDKCQFEFLLKFFVDKEILQLKR